MNVLSTLERNYVNTSRHFCDAHHGITHYNSRLLCCFGSPFLSDGAIALERATVSPFATLFKGEGSLDEKNPKIHSKAQRLFLYVISGPLMSLANVVYHVVALVYRLFKLIKAFMPCTKEKVFEQLGPVLHHINSIARNAIRCIPLVGIPLTKYLFDLPEYAICTAAKAVFCRNKIVQKTAK